ncbi:cupredoxin domain-containing protein [Patescibacteria group bacterium]|nr:cupredoxin domain-containing protein [Patescibacteria group bacterium]
MGSIPTPGTDIMEDTARLIIIFLFIGLIVVAVVFFGILVLAPFGGKGLFSGTHPTSTVVYINNGVPAPTSSAVYSTSGLPFTSPQSTGVYSSSGGSGPLPTVEGGTRQAITSQIPTPSADATNVPSNVAVPTSVQQTGAIAERSFIITGTGGKFSPNTIVVNQGDVVNLTLVAADAAYNIFFPDFGVTITAKKGQTVSAQFQPANYGQYKFYCKDVCSGSPEGTLVVNQ